MKKKTPERAELKDYKTTIEDRRLKSAIEKRSLKSNIESSYDDPYGKRTDTLDLKAQSHAPSYGVIGKAGESRVSQLISGLKSNKEMVILQEIIGLPKSLR